jgi:hypothetical protein
MLFARVVPGRTECGEAKPIGMQKSAEGIAGARARAEGPNGWQEGSLDGGPSQSTCTAAGAALRGAKGRSLGWRAFVCDLSSSSENHGQKGRYTET